MGHPPHRLRARGALPTPPRQRRPRRSPAADAAVESRHADGRSRRVRAADGYGRRTLTTTSTTGPGPDRRRLGHSTGATTAAPPPPAWESQSWAPPPPSVTPPMPPVPPSARQLTRAVAVALRRHGRASSDHARVHHYRHVQPAARRRRHRDPPRQQRHDPPHRGRDPGRRTLAPSGSQWSCRRGSAAAHGLIPIGILLLFVTLPAATIDVPLSGGTGAHAIGRSRRSELRSKYEMGIGNLSVDLTEAPLVGHITHIRAQLGIGELTLDVPSTVKLVVHGHAGSGRGPAVRQQRGRLAREPVPHCAGHRRR